MTKIKDELVDENSEQDVNMMETYPSSPTSPLDFSKNSKTIVFSHPKTPEKSSVSPFFKSKTASLFYSQLPIFLFQAPVILTQPKSEWHYRNIRDLANKHIPLLSGEGPQRTPIRIQIPQQLNFELYLSIRNLDINGHPHRSKMIIPAKTTVNMEKLNHENNLECLQFDQCDPNDRCFAGDAHIISKITPEDHRAQMKDIRICMFNLYQTTRLTKDIIEENQLQTCRLSFQFGSYKDGVFAPLSPMSFSNDIYEKKNTSKMRRHEYASSGTFSGFCFDDMSSEPCYSEKSSP